MTEKDLIRFIVMKVSKNGFKKTGKDSFSVTWNSETEEDKNDIVFKYLVAESIKRFEKDFFAPLLENKSINLNNIGLSRVFLTVDNNNVVSMNIKTVSGFFYKIESLVRKTAKINNLLKLTAEDSYDIYTIDDYSIEYAVSEWCNIINPFMNN